MDVMAVHGKRGDEGWNLEFDHSNSSSHSTTEELVAWVRSHLDQIEPEVDHSGLDIRIVP